ncbi:MAG: hypothetical protein ACHQQS_06610 [Thermoanaerobaculales bacterium]
MNALGFLSRAKPGAGAVVAPADAPAPVQGVEEAALRDATETHDAARQRLTELQARRDAVQQETTETADKRVTLAKRLASGEEVSRQLAEVESELVRLRAHADGLATLILEAEQNELASRMQHDIASAAVRILRNKAEAAELAAEARRLIAQARAAYRTLCHSRGLLVGVLDRLSERDARLANSVAYEMSEPDPLRELTAGGSREVFSPRWRIGSYHAPALIPPTVPPEG